MDPTSVLPSSVPAITPTIIGKSSALYICTKMLSYLLFPPLASSIGPEGESSEFCEMKMGEKLPEDRPDLVPIVTESGKKLAQSSSVAGSSSASQLGSSAGELTGGPGTGNRVISLELLWGASEGKGLLGVPIVKALNPPPPN